MFFGSPRLLHPIAALVALVTLLSGAPEFATGTRRTAAAAPAAVHGEFVISEAARELVAVASRHSMPRTWQTVVTLASLLRADLALTRGFGAAATGMQRVVSSIGLIARDPAIVLAHVPIRGVYSLSSEYGLRRHPVLHKRKLHRGVDLAADGGTPVVASGSGTVTLAGRMGGYGKIIVIDHGDGLTTRYAHLRQVGVAEGQKVEPGERIGAVGRSGRATGTHLHFEVRLDGRDVDPQEYVHFALNK